MRAEDHIRVRWALSQLLHASLESLPQAFLTLELTLDEITCDDLVPWDLIETERLIRLAVNLGELEEARRLAGDAIPVLDMGRAS